MLPQVHLGESEWSSKSRAPAPSPPQTASATSLLQMKQWSPCPAAAITKGHHAKINEITANKVSLLWFSFPDIQVRQEVKLTLPSDCDHVTEVCVYRRTR
ncbi:hypothetical protein GOODEAATRI_015871 [Goodea atripinnis]|uniref:Uncharacterized protein n=1 Tax=Goodea atripinnis TaxID=208336 RepID=A0ABV0PYB9_9TELE